MTEENYGGRMLREAVAFLLKWAEAGLLGKAAVARFDTFESTGFKSQVFVVGPEAAEDFLKHYRAFQEEMAATHGDRIQSFTKSIKTDGSFEDAKRTVN